MGVRRPSCSCAWRHGTACDTCFTWRLLLRPGGVRWRHHAQAAACTGAKRFRAARSMPDKARGASAGMRESAPACVAATPAGALRDPRPRPLLPHAQSCRQGGPATRAAACGRGDGRPARTPVVGCERLASRRPSFSRRSRSPPARSGPTVGRSRSPRCRAARRRCGRSPPPAPTPCSPWSRSGRRRGRPRPSASRC